MASRNAVRETSSDSLKAASVGRTSPGASLPETIRVPRSWATMLCRLRLA